MPGHQASALRQATRPRAQGPLGVQRMIAARRTTQGGGATPQTTQRRTQNPQTRQQRTGLAHPTTSRDDAARRRTRQDGRALRRRQPLIADRQTTAPDGGGPGPPGTRLDGPALRRRQRKGLVRRPTDRADKARGTMQQADRAACRMSTKRALPKTAGPAARKIDLREQLEPTALSSNAIRTGAQQPSPRLAARPQEWMLAAT
jgi:hypothetical protein